MHLSLGKGAVPLQRPEPDHAVGPVPCRQPGLRHQAVGGGGEVLLPATVGVVHQCPVGEPGSGDVLRWR